MSATADDAVCHSGNWLFPANVGLRAMTLEVGTLYRRNPSKPETSLFAKQIFYSLTHSRCRKPRLRLPRYSHLFQLDQHAQRTLKLAIQVCLVARELLELIGNQPLAQSLIFDVLMVAGLFIHLDD